MTDALAELQRQLARAIRHGNALEKDAELTALAREHISGNERLSPVEQLEIYREQFWLRHTSSLVEDFPGLCGILGQDEWEKLVESYLRAVAPVSYTLRDLGSRLPEIIEQATWLSHQALCLDMARLELAYLEVFDAADTPPLGPERLGSIPEERLGDARLVVAPSVRLLSLGFPVADLRRRLRYESGEPVAIPEPSARRLVVYRRELRLWDMPLSPVAFAFLAALSTGRPLAAAAELAAATPEAEAELGSGIGSWLREWTAKGLISDIALE
jgi:hypothetical protein